MYHLCNWQNPQTFKTNTDFVNTSLASQVHGKNWRLNKQTLLTINNHQIKNAHIKTLVFNQDFSKWTNLLNILREGYYFHTRFTPSNLQYTNLLESQIILKNNVYSGLGSYLKKLRYFKQSNIKYKTWVQSNKIFFQSKRKISTQLKLK